MALLRAVVVRIDLRAELDLLDDRLRLVLARLPGLDRGLVLELAVVNELADRRPRSRCDLDQVEIGFGSQLKCLTDRDDPDLLPLRSYEPDLGSTDALVNTRFDADVTSMSLPPAAGPSGGGSRRPCPRAFPVRAPEGRTRESPASKRSAGQPRLRHRPRGYPRGAPCQLHTRHHVRVLRAPAAGTSGQTRLPRCVPGRPGGRWSSALRARRRSTGLVSDQA